MFASPPMSFTHLSLAVASTLITSSESVETLYLGFDSALRLQPNIILNVSIVDNLAIWLHLSLWKRERKKLVLLTW